MVATCVTAGVAVAVVAGARPSVVHALGRTCGDVETDARAGPRPATADSGPARLPTRDYWLVKRVESGEDLYVDEDGEAYQLAHGSSGKPLAVKITPLRIEAPQSASNTARA